MSRPNPIVVAISEKCLVFSDLPKPRQRRFNRHTLRLIELTEKADEEIRRDLFERINTGSQELSDMEKRWGSMDGDFLRFVRTCAEMEIFAELAPLPAASVKRRERQEFALRFFAYKDRYQKFERRVDHFLDGYIKDMASSFDAVKSGELHLEWTNMLAFVRENCSHGFSKKDGHTRTPRVRFEAISVGVSLALDENPRLSVRNMDWVTTDDEFRRLTTSGSSNSKPKIKKRIEYVRDRLLSDGARSQ